jgi:hypothetical protein
MYLTISRVAGNLFLIPKRANRKSQFPKLIENDFTFGIFTHGESWILPDLLSRTLFRSTNFIALERLFVRPVTILDRASRERSDPTM